MWALLFRECTSEAAVLGACWHWKHYFHGFSIGHEILIPFPTGNLHVIDSLTTIQPWLAKITNMLQKYVWAIPVIAIETQLYSINITHFQDVLHYYVRALYYYLNFKLLCSRRADWTRALRDSISQESRVNGQQLHVLSVWSLQVLTNVLCIWIHVEGLNWWKLM